MRVEIIFVFGLWLALQIPLGSFVGECLRGAAHEQLNDGNPLRI